MGAAPKTRRWVPRFQMLNAKTQLHMPPSANPPPTSVCWHRCHLQGFQLSPMMADAYIKELKGLTGGLDWPGLERIGLGSELWAAASSCTPGPGQGL